MQVIGDKKAAQASKILREADGIEALKRLEKKVGVQLKFIHVMRNPFDNIATMTLRRADVNKMEQGNLKVSTCGTSSHFHLYLRNRKHVPCFYQVIEKWKFGRTRNAVGTRAAGECFHSFFEFSQTFTSVSITR